MTRIMRSVLLLVAVLLGAAATARDYMPATGRYMQFDPTGLEAGPNGYTYVHANPLTGFDPTGLANGGAAQMWMNAPQRCKDDDCLCRCLEEYLGLETAAGAGIIAAGLPLIEKPFVTPGSSPATSVASTAASRVFGNKRLPGRWWAPTAAVLGAMTNSAARFFGRWVPGVGWVLTGADGYQVSQCKGKCEDDKCRRASF